MINSNNKKISVLITAIATTAIMVAGTAATASPVLGLGHYDEGSNDAASQEYDRFEDCLTDHEHESSEVTEEQIEHCIDLAYHGEGDESSREENGDSHEDEGESNLKDSAFFGDDSEDSSNNFNSDHDSADEEGSSTDY